MQTGGLDDEDITASSKLDNFTATDAWCSQDTDENQYLQIDLGEKTKLTRIATQGALEQPEKHVKTFAVLHSMDGKKFQTYKANGTEQVRRQKIIKPLVAPLKAVYISVRGNSFFRRVNNPDHR